MSDQEERNEDYKKELIDSGHEKRDGFVKKHPKLKQYCEDCEYIQLYDCMNADDALALAKCLENPKITNEAPLAKRFDVTTEYNFCTTSRMSCPDRCDKFKGKLQTT
ncbi:hypothetical protein LCGC14_0619310 [marine sediment metagenome]|uniref:Uncharacterized protein n=1 Tax=marine sediment metagenome TaxID=412755 RepID=A0A0F9RA68_9ZZZZ|nr:hypothetical protein [Actinomycetota bacterium]